MIDLHTHSTFSDGTFTPTEIIDKAEELGLKAVALTDHNTISGLKEFMSSSKGKRVEAIPGIELSTSYKNTDVHIVGLFIPIEGTDELNECLREHIKLKELNNKLTVKKLNMLGYKIDYDELKSKHPSGQLNRLHMAKALMEAGYVETVSEAFNNLLDEKNGYYESCKHIKTAEAIRIIKEAGGVAVLAHPLCKPTNYVVHALLNSSMSNGLDAIEIQHSSYSKQVACLARKLAKEHGLLDSYGSDFHGLNKPDVRLGTGVDYNLHSDDSALEKLRARAKKAE